MNVEASGFQHEKFFADVEAMVLKIFDAQPVERQPHYVADMGCGDGTLLRRIYTVVHDRSARGRVLDRHPLKMIGVDFNEKALQATARTLAAAGIPHMVVPGDIGIHPAGAAL